MAGNAPDKDALVRAELRDDDGGGSDDGVLHAGACAEIESSNTERLALQAVPFYTSQVSGL